ncbi:MAG: phosphoribosylamine--glycine ligase family protein, partial [Bacteroidales bacterium]|nr:phosphoribosylamine--glycine ligase family protein [Bacteroidales bacterium]MDY4141756.1 phosphoribosylamine--glycine ligase N-terminal domain-containing protein [Sodaliphilus sp.]
MKQKILLLGSGGRECAIAWKLSQSELLDSLYIAPGNAGTAQYGTNVSLSPMDFDAVGKFAADNGIT